MKDLQVAEAAADDVAEILLYYAAPSQASDLFAKRLEDALLHLCRWPETGRKRDDLSGSPVLFWLSKPYFIVYQVSGDTLFVVAILHTARNIRDVLRVRLGSLYQP